MPEWYNRIMGRVNYTFRRVKIIPNGCWEWQTGINYKTGYASWGGELVHRKFYKIFRGEIPEGLVIDHLCKNRRCANPQHLEAVTQRENVLRGDTNIVSINAKKRQCKNGHEFTPVNTYVYIRKNGSKRRDCRECRNLACLRWEKSFA